MDAIIPVLLNNHNFLYIFTVLYAEHHHEPETAHETPERNS